MAKTRTDLSAIPFPESFREGAANAVHQCLRVRPNERVVVISDEADTLALAQSPIRLPPRMPEWLTPLVGILPAQLFACHLTTVKGYDTDKPRTLTKVTETH